MRISTLQGLQDVQLLLGGGVALRRKCQCGPLKEGQDGWMKSMKSAYRFLHTGAE